MKWYFWLIGICIIAGCSNFGSGNSVLSEDKMTRVLWDMIQVDELATLQLAKDTGKNAKNERIQLYQKVFQLHEVSEKQFAESYNYYARRPDLLKTLFDSLEAKGVRERKNIYLKKDPVAK